MNREVDVTIVTITNERALGEAIARVVERGVSRSPDVRRLTYRECSAVLTQELIEEAHFFVLDLIRSYPGGRRAEGIALAETLVRRGKSVLIISPLSLGDRLDCRCYWDVSHPEDLAAHIRRLLENPYDALDDLARLRRFFQSLMEIPPQHKK